MVIFHSNVAVYQRVASVNLWIAKKDMLLKLEMLRSKYPPRIKRSNGKCPINGLVSGKIISHKWRIFQQNIFGYRRVLGYGSIPIDTFLLGWTSICQLFWGSLGTRVLTHSHISIITSRSKNPIRWVSNWPKVCSRPVLFFDAARRWLRLLQILFRS